MIKKKEKKDDDKKETEKNTAKKKIGLSQKYFPVPHWLEVWSRRRPPNTAAKTPATASAKWDKSSLLILISPTHQKPAILPILLERVEIQNILRL